MPLQITLALLAPLALSLIAAYRSLRGAPFAAHWAAAAALMAPLGGLAIELTWQPAELIGAWPWALHALALAGGMTGLAARFARLDGTDRLRAALASLSALACLAFACSVILTQAALTLALAVTVLAAAALDRRFDLPAMTGYIVAGIVALGYRLVADPGIGWAVDVPMTEMLVAYGGTLAAVLTARWLVIPRNRPRAQIFLESSAWSVGALTLSMVIYHLVESLTGHPLGAVHWVFGLHTSVWCAAALAQLDRLQLSAGWMRGLRIALSIGLGAMALVFLALGLTLGNPLLERQSVSGLPLLNTLAPAYLAPALVLLAGAWRLRRSGHLPRLVLQALSGLGLALTAYWAALVTRHFWQGADAMKLSEGLSQPELYSYTVELLLVGAGLFLRALQRPQDGFRRAGIVVIALAVAKVFLIDAAGLDGLARVFSFLLLGLSLAGLAWLNRWVQMRAT